MINISKILKRSWQILWNYRTLWIFGILLALTMGGGSSSGSNSSGSTRSNSTPNNPSNFNGTLPENTPQWLRELANWGVQNIEPLFTHPAQHVGTFVLIGVIILVIILFFSLLAAMVRYPAETAVMRMVDDYEHSGSKVGFRQGWKLGWTRRAFRLWLIDLILGIPAFVFMLLLALIGVVIFAIVSSGNPAANVVGIIIGIGIGLVALLALIVVATLLSLLRNFFARAAALEGKGTTASLRHGWAMFKRNWKNAGVMWLVMVGIGIGYGIAGIIIFFLLIPLYLILLLPAALIAALPALIGFGITSLFASGPLAWIVGALFGLPFFFITLFSPLIFINGWYKLYQSNVWTLTYREIQALENLAPVEPTPPAVIPPAA